MSCIPTKPTHLKSHTKNCIQKIYQIYDLASIRWMFSQYNYTQTYLLLMITYYNWFIYSVSFIEYLFSDLF